MKASLWFIKWKAKLWRERVVFAAVCDKADEWTFGLCNLWPYSVLLWVESVADLESLCIRRASLLLCFQGFGSLIELGFKHDHFLLPIKVDHTVWDLQLFLLGLDAIFLNLNFHGLLHCNLKLVLRWFLLDPSTTWELSRNGPLDEYLLYLAHHYQVHFSTVCLRKLHRQLTIRNFTHGFLWFHDFERGHMLL